MTTESPAVRELRRFLSLCGFADKADAVLAELAETKTLLAHKNETANTFMNQVKKLQAELAACRAESGRLKNDLIISEREISRLNENLKRSKR